MDWLVSMYRSEKAPVLTVLAEANEDQLRALKTAWIEAMQLTGEADINRTPATSSGGTHGSP